MAAGLKPALDCIEQLPETDLTAELPGIDIPVLVAQGDADQIVPIAAAAPRTAELLPNATLKVFPGRPARPGRGVRAGVHRRAAGVGGGLGRAGPHPIPVTSVAAAGVRSGRSPQVVFDDRDNIRLPRRTRRSSSAM